MKPKLAAYHDIVRDRDKLLCNQLDSFCGCEIDYSKSKDSFLKSPSTILSVSMTRVLKISGFEMIVNYAVSYTKNFEFLNKKYYYWEDNLTLSKDNESLVNAYLNNIMVVPDSCFKYIGIDIPRNVKKTFKKVKRILSSDNIFKRALHSESKAFDIRFARKFGL